MRKLFIVCSIAMLLVTGASSVHAQGVITAWDKAILDQWYQNLTSSISGSLLVTGSVPIEALGFVVVTQEVDPLFVSWSNGGWLVHTGNESAHHEKFEVGEEQDQIFTNWWATNIEYHVTTRLVQTNSPYTILGTDKELFYDTDAGSITSTLPAGIDGAWYRMINTGGSNNSLTVQSNGSELLLGLTNNVVLLDGDALRITYESTEGWW